MPDTLNRQKETFIVPADSLIQQVGGANFAERAIDGAYGPLNVTVQNMGAGDIMLEMRQGVKSLSLDVVDEDIGPAGATGIIAVDGTLVQAQCVPGTVSIVCDADTWADDGEGTLVAGDDNVSTTTVGTIDYFTGAIVLDATGATNDADVFVDYAKGWVYAGEVRESMLVTPKEPGTRIDIYGYGPAAAATYLECIVEGNIAGSEKGAATIS